MKIFLLFCTIIYLVLAILSIIKMKTSKSIIDNAIDLAQKQMNKKDNTSTFDVKTYKTTLSVTYLVISIPTTIYLLLCVKFVGTFWFSALCILYMIWGFYDLVKDMDYLNNDEISWSINSKLYKALSAPFDLAFIGYMLYNLFLRW